MKNTLKITSILLIVCVLLLTSCATAEKTDDTTKTAEKTDDTTKTEETTAQFTADTVEEEETTAQFTADTVEEIKGLVSLSAAEITENYTLEITHVELGGCPVYKVAELGEVYAVFTVPLNRNEKVAIGSDVPDMIRVADKAIVLENGLHPKITSAEAKNLGIEWTNVSYNIVNYSYLTYLEDDAFTYELVWVTNTDDFEKWTATINDGDNFDNAKEKFLSLFESETDLTLSSIQIFAK